VKDSLGETQLMGYHADGLFLEQIIEQREAILRAWNDIHGD
jgi:hypothetical protein